MYETDFSVLIKSFPIIANGIWTTVYISVISCICAFLLGLIIAFIRTSKSIFSSILQFFVEFIRNTPLLIQLYFYYKALPALGINFPGVICGIIALSIYTGAYISEVLRAGINSVAHEQYQASLGLGFTRFQAFKLIIFPQAIRNVIPPLGSQFINLVKNSSLVSFIAVTDIFYVIYKGAADDFRIYEYFVLGIVVYMSLTGFISLITNYAEQKYKIHGKAQGL